MIINCANPTLFLAGLPVGIAPAALLEMFEHLGVEIEFNQIMRRRKGVPMQYASAFVRLTNPDEAEKAIKALNGTLMEGHAITCRKYINETNKPRPRPCFHSPINKVWAAHVAGETQPEARQ